MEDIEVIDNEHSLLVSDSNEVSEQFDSKKLEYSLIVELFQDKLFKEHIGILDNYLLKTKYDYNNKLISDSFNQIKDEWDGIKNKEWSRKLKVVPGQVILIKKSRVPDDIDLQEYIRRYWNIPSNYQLVRIQDCMLRGVTEIEDSSIKNHSMKTVGLSESNVPSHMHNSSITSGSGILSSKGVVKSSENGDESYGSQYDMFYDESMSVGMDQNELNGTIDSFTVYENGKDAVFHNNIPSCQLFYAFEVKLI